jgi:hypothetical protein
MKARKIIESVSGLEISKKSLEDRYPLVSGNEDGFDIGTRVPNTGSISASFSDYETLSGIRKIPLSEFFLIGKSYSVDGTNKIEQLAREIHHNKFIAPLIVVIDDEGFYILEGIHRAEALFKLGVKFLPAIVVVDLENVDLCE